MPHLRLLVSCADRPGIVAGIAGFLAGRGANITQSAQHTSDPEGGRFFMRIEFDVADAEDLEEAFGVVAEEFSLHWRIWDAARPKRIAILLSREEHCLLELLWRRRRGELDAEIVQIASNHDLARRDADAFGVAFEHVPVDPEDKLASEARLLELLAGRCDLVVLARYMQILSGGFLDGVGVPIINIHHSFLPAFAGAGPYTRAKERGVKLIGATGHYVTEELDAGPIIEQDVIRVTHRDDVEALTRLGAEVERTVLARAVQWHCEDRVIVHENTTVVF